MSDDDTSELPNLTDKQYKFVQGIQKGLSNSDAYRQAYDCSNHKTETVWRNAAALASNDKVATWLDYIRRESVNKLVDETSYTLIEHIKELNDAIAFAKEQKATGPMITAITAKGKACNHYTQHKEININNAADIQLIDKLEQLLGHEAAMQAAQNMGYTPESLEQRKH